jgi:hypothetical protein
VTPARVDEQSAKGGTTFETSRCLILRAEVIEGVVLRYYPAFF